MGGSLSSPGEGEEAENVSGDENSIQVEREFVSPRRSVSVTSLQVEQLASQRDARLALEAKREEEKPWETERRELYEQRERELREAETALLDEVKQQVSELEETYDFVRPPPKPRCVTEENAVVNCYQEQLDKKDGDVLRCAKFVDAYSDCARQVAADLAKAIKASSS